MIGSCPERRAKWAVRPLVTLGFPISSLAAFVSSMSMKPINNESSDVIWGSGKALLVSYTLVSRNAFCCSLRSCLGRCWTCVKDHTVPHDTM